MKWKIKDRVVKDENGEVVCILSENASENHIALIRYASDMFDAILDFNGSIEQTRIQRNPKKHYEKFRKLEEKINQDSE